jgi:hypothetical protein
VPNVVAADKATMVASFIPQEANTPITRLIIGVVGTAVADIFAVLACEPDVVLLIVVQNVVPVGIRPYPVAILREKPEDNGIGSFIGHCPWRE